MQSSDVPWQRLTELVDLHGNRITGSTALENALVWAAKQMRDDGLDDVRLEPVAVPHWVRGEERARIVRPVDRPMALLGLGGSVGTKETLRAPIVAFDSLDALRASPAPLDGRIAFVNHRLPPFDEAHDDPGYREGVQARIHAASEGARRGAIAVLVRSVTAVSLRTPHAGALSYDDGVRKIPAAAVSTEDADLLARLAQRGPVEVELFARRAHSWRTRRARTPSASCAGGSSPTRSSCSARTSIRGTSARARPTTAPAASRSWTRSGSCAPAA